MPRARPHRPSPLGGWLLRVASGEFDFVESDVDAADEPLGTLLGRPFDQAGGEGLVARGDGPQVIRDRDRFGKVGDRSSDRWREKAAGRRKLLLRPESPLLLG
jgi:hypothetical protein